MQAQRTKDLAPLAAYGLQKLVFWIEKFGTPDKPEKAQTHYQRKAEERKEEEKTEKKARKAEEQRKRVC